MGDSRGRRVWLSGRRFALPSTGSLFPNPLAASPPPDPENCIVLREFDHNYIHKEGLNMIEYVHSSAMVMAAGSQGGDAIKTFDFETGKCLSEFKFKSDENLNPYHGDISEADESRTERDDSSLASDSIAASYESKVHNMLNGGNSSLVHTDFMIGSSEMQIDGIKADGSSEPVMRDGEWAFDI